MTSIKGQKITLASRPVGKPVPGDFRLEEDVLAEPQEGEVLLATRYLSLDPYMRGRMNDSKSYAAPTPIGGVMEGEVVAEVIASRNSDFVVGGKVAAHIGWRSHAISDGTNLTKLDSRFAPISTALGVLGMPGMTANSGLLTIGKPKAGETIVVAAASGPVGSMVGQIAKIYGARAVGIAGGADKCAFVKEALGFDAAIDHRSPTFAADLAAACPNGIDVYFELVGGKVWEAVLPLLNDHARVPVCGLVADYNNVTHDGTARSAPSMLQVLVQSLTVRGFIVTEFWDQRPKFLNDTSAWIAEGKIRFREDVVKGLANAPEALTGMLEGKNFGKLLVELD